MPDLGYFGWRFSNQIADGFRALTPVFHNDIYRVPSFLYSYYKVETGCTESEHRVSLMAFHNASFVLSSEIDVVTFCFRLWHSVHESNARFLFRHILAVFHPP